MTLSTLIMVLVLPSLALAMVLSLVRLARGPQLPDRVVALDMLAMPGIAVAAVCAIAFDQPALLDVASVIALVSFLGTVAFAYYMERR